MEADRWHQVNDLLESVWDLQPEEQEQYLRRACGGDDELLDKVLRMLNRAAEEPTFIEEPAIAAGDVSYDMPRRIGPYRLQRELGRGGMGAVYLGLREEDGFVQQVAVKLIKKGMDSDEIVRRFRKERRILAGLEHPNIARLIDGGTSEDGQPYFVMEYVEGVPIDRYCREKKLNIAQRITLFRQVCEAVHFINQNLVVHRDLKPSNILITAEGLPKLLDFGIATFLDRRDDPTRTSMRAMTPEYASPEQIQGLPVSTAGDVYSLGVLLYLLLTDHGPYRLARGGLRELEDAICNGEITRPSNAVSGEWVSRDTMGEEVRIAPRQVAMDRREEPAALARKLRGDLDHIVLMALRKEARHRYGSAQALADDLERYQAGFPVIAHRGSWRYHTLKFIRRNRVAVLSAGALLTLLTVFALTMAIQRQAIARERDKAREMSSFLIDLFQRADYKAEQGDSVTSREILDMQRRLLGNDHPDVAKSLFQLASLLNAGGDRRGALPLYEEALQIRIKALGSDHPEVATTHYTLGFLFMDLGRYQEAETHLTAAGKIVTEVTQSLQILLARARLANRRDNYELALELYRRAYARTEREPRVRSYRVSTDHNIGLILAQMGRTDEALPHLRRSLEAYRRMLPEEHPQIATGLLHLGALLAHLGRTSEAEPLLREALLYHQNNMPSGDYRIGQVHETLGFCLAEQGCFEEAEFHLEEGLAILTNEPKRAYRYLDRAIFRLYLLYKSWDRSEKAEEWADWL